MKQDWAAPGDMENLNIKWHEPTSFDLELTDKLLFSFLKPEIDQLKLFIIGQLEIER